MLSFIDLSKEKYSCYGNVTGGSDGRECACSAGDRVRSLDREDSLEDEMATNSNILAWRIPRRELRISGGLRSTGLPRVGHD